MNETNPIDQTIALAREAAAEARNLARNRRRICKLFARADLSGVPEVLPVARAAREHSDRLNEVGKTLMGAFAFPSDLNVVSYLHEYLAKLEDLTAEGFERFAAGVREGRMETVRVELSFVVALAQIHQALALDVLAEFRRLVETGPPDVRNHFRDLVVYVEESIDRNRVDGTTGL